jgi:predicted PolB exonuclease-like 3'-5' exonuclease
LFINSGWLIGAGLIPAVFANNAVDLYTLNTLALDMPEVTLRRILYDHLFLRHAAPYDDTKYSADNLNQFAQYYNAHHQCVVGLGHLLGPNMWYPDHPEILSPAGGNQC